MESLASRSAAGMVPTRAGMVIDAARFATMRGRSRKLVAAPIIDPLQAVEVARTAGMCDFFQWIAFQPVRLPAG
jgi:hypothetical protein